MNSQSWFELRTPRDLYKKAQFDFSRLQENPQDQYAAFDFFVTVEHMTDWVQNKGIKGYKAIRRTVPILRVCSHVANGCKHFVADRHESVNSTHTFNGPYQRQRPYQAKRFYSAGMEIELHGADADALGEFIDVASLAEQLLKYWDSKLSELGW